MKINGLTVLWFFIATGLISFALNLWQKEAYKAPDLKEIFKNVRPVKHWQDDEEVF